MDPDGPAGPAQPFHANTFITTKLFYNNPISPTYLPYHTAKTGGVLDLSWTSGANSCTMVESVPYPAWTDPKHIALGGSFGGTIKTQTDFTYKDLPGNGSLMFGLPGYGQYVTGVKFVITCGSQSSTLYARQTGYYNASDSYLISPSAITGTPKVDLKVAVDSSDIANYGPYTFTDGPATFSCGQLTDHAKTLSCKLAVIWSGANVSSCLLSGNTPVTEPGVHPDGLVAGNQGSHQTWIGSEYINGPVIITATCKNASGATATDSVTITK